VVILTTGGGRFVSRVVGCVLGVLGVLEVVAFVVGGVAVDGVTCSVVVGVAAGDR